MNARDHLVNALWDAEHALGVTKKALERAAGGRLTEEQAKVAAFDAHAAWKRSVEALSMHTTGRA